MVKDRKAQFGATNLSARSDSSASNGHNTSKPVNFTRSWTHKLISPDVYQQKDNNPDNTREIANTATWLPLAIHNRDFNSTTTSSYVDPRKIPVKVRKILSSKEIEEGNIRAEAQGESIEALSKLARKSYGTTGAMLKSFNKKNGDTVHIDEFGGYLKRNKLDMYISENDRKNIFDAVDPKHDGTIQVSDLLKRTEEQEFHESEHKKDMTKIRDFLSQHVEKNREVLVMKETQQRSPDQKRVDADLAAIKKKKAVVNEVGLMKTALGTKAFDLDISPDELQSVINSMYDKFPGDESQRQFARFLKLSNLNLDTIPFYDMRKENLDALKHRAATIEQTLHGDDLQDRFKSLSETRWRGSLAASGVATGSPLVAHQKDHPSLSLSMSLPNLSINSPGKLPPRRGQLSSLQHKPHKNLLTHSTPGADYDHDGIQSIVSRSASSLHGGSSVHEGGSLASTAGADSPTAKSLRAMKLKEELFDGSNTNEARASDFYTQVVDSSASMGRMKDPTKVMRIEKIDPLAYSPQGRRALARGPTDWSRVGIGGDRAPDDVGYGRAGSGDDRFSTTNSEFFTPLIYQPSMPVTRGGVSDAEAATQLRNYRRKERHDRMAANMDVTKTRLEYEVVEKGMREMRNQHSQVIDKIRYETAMLLNDLQNYKKQPLQRMNRRPNLNLSDKMWGGNQGKQTVVLVTESRDFNTTYNSSFQSSALITK